MEDTNIKLDDIEFIDTETMEEANFMELAVYLQELNKIDALTTAIVDSNNEGDNNG